jgi:hypothetical protein
VQAEGESACDQGSQACARHQRYVVSHGFHLVLLRRPAFTWPAD